MSDGMDPRQYRDMGGWHRTGGEIRASVGARMAAEMRGQTNPQAQAQCSGAMHVFESRSSAECVCGERQRPAADKIGGEHGEETMS